jgi:hypothetical protein
MPGSRKKQHRLDNPVGKYCFFRGIGKAINKIQGKGISGDSDLYK